MHIFFSRLTRCNQTCKRHFTRSCIKGSIAHEEPDLCVNAACSTQRRVKLTHEGKHENRQIKPTSCSLWDVSKAEGNSSHPPDLESSVAICRLKGWTPYFHSNCVDAGSPWQQDLGPGMESYQQLSIRRWAATSPKANVLRRIGINHYHAIDRDGVRWKTLTEMKMESRGPGGAHSSSAMCNWTIIG